MQVLSVWPTKESSHASCTDTACTGAPKLECGGGRQPFRGYHGCGCRGLYRCCGTLVIKGSLACPSNPSISTRCISESLTSIIEIEELDPGVRSQAVRTARNKNNISRIKFIFVRQSHAGSRLARGIHCRHIGCSHWVVCRPGLPARRCVAKAYLKALCGGLSIH